MSQKGGKTSSVTKCHGNGVWFKGYHGCLSITFWRVQRSIEVSSCFVPPIENRPVLVTRDQNHEQARRSPRLSSSALSTSMLAFWQCYNMESKKDTLADTDMTYPEKNVTELIRVMMG